MPAPRPPPYGDRRLFDLTAHFDRGRKLDRLLHAKGSGAFGYFEVTDDVSDLSAAAFLQGVGTRTRTLTRFSIAGGPKAQPDSTRAPRGFATKLYTQDGALDWVFNSTPVFFIRDPTKMPQFIASGLPDPLTNLPDPAAGWEFFTQNPETLHQLLVVNTRRGLPASFRHLNGYSGHAYVWRARGGDANYVRVHLRTEQGVKGLTTEEAGRAAAANPSHDHADLWEAIEKGNGPAWTAYVQVVSPAEAAKLDFSVFDITKTWPHAQFPLRRFGRLVLNQNPADYTAEVEHAAFSPANVVPGWEPSADPVLQARLRSYADPQANRLGPGFAATPVNSAPGSQAVPAGAGEPEGRDANPGVPQGYAPQRYARAFGAGDLPSGDLGDPGTGDRHGGDGDATSWDDVSDVDFAQPAALWELLGKTPGEQDDLVGNLAAGLRGQAEPVQKRAFALFARASKDLATRVEKAVKE